MFLHRKTHYLVTFTKLNKFMFYHKTLHKNFKDVFRAVPARLNIAIMTFLACAVNYMLRVNISVIIIAMVRQNSTTNSVKSECEVIKNNSSYLTADLLEPDSKWTWRQREGPVVFNWTAQEQAYVLSSYFWSYTITCFLGGVLVEALGPRRLLFYTTLLSAVLNILAPLAAQLHYMALVVIRFVMGGAAGILFPALHDLVVRWAPPEEKGKFVSAQLGSAIGTVITWSLTGLLIEKYGWDYAFYVSGAIVVVWCAFWWFLVYDSPIEHPRISNAEKEYILKAIGDQVEQSSKKRPIPPYRSIFTSLPFLAMIILQYGNAWGVYFIMTAAPKYVSSALGFKLSSTGTLASLPYLARLIFALIFGVIGDRIVKSNKFSTTCIRKFFSIFSHVIPGLLLIALGYVGCSPILSIALITLSLGFNGSVTLTCLVNHQDLAPNFAATMFGIANGFGNTAGFLSPLVTGHFTKNGNGFAEWRPIFLAGGSFYIATAIYFVIFGTAETQSWNYINKSEEERNYENSTESKSTKINMSN